MDDLSVLVCVTGQKTCHRLIREGDRLAKELNAQLCVLHVAKPGAGLLGGAASEEAEALEYLFKISRDHGAQTSMIRSEDAAATIAQHAQKVNALVLVLGTPRKGRLDFTDQLRLRIPETQFHMVYTEE